MGHRVVGQLHEFHDFRPKNPPISWSSFAPSISEFFLEDGKPMFFIAKTQVVFHGLSAFEDTQSRWCCWQIRDEAAWQGCVFFHFLRFFLNHRLDCKMDVLRFISGLKFLENYRANNQFIYFRWCSFEKGCLEMCHISEDFSLFSSSPCQGERTAGVPPTGTGRARLVDNVVRKNGGIFVFVRGWTRHAPKKQNQLRRWLPFFSGDPKFEVNFSLSFFWSAWKKKMMKKPKVFKAKF